MLDPESQRRERSLTRFGTFESRLLALELHIREAQNTASPPVRQVVQEGSGGFRGDGREFEGSRRKYEPPGVQDGTSRETDLRSSDDSGSSQRGLHQGPRGEETGLLLSVRSSGCLRQESRTTGGKRETPNRAQVQRPAHGNGGRPQGTTSMALAATEVPRTQEHKEVVWPRWQW